MMNTQAQKVEPVVILVDSKIRDLDVAVLIASHLNTLGIECFLEPLEAFRAVLAAYRPGMIVFNHLTASHLAAWSKKLAGMGVMTAVLPNEGIAYDPDDLRFLAGKYHGDAHIDYVFAWNEPYREAVHKLQEEVNSLATKIEVVGVPRFDFYFEPWARLQDRQQKPSTQRAKLLVCTNFVTARYSELPREHGDRFFAPWAGRIPLYSDYWNAIEAHRRSRNRVLTYIEALIKADKFNIVLRPHPAEAKDFYEDWMKSLNAEQKKHLHLDSTSPINSLILNCDLEISCETCTTALESWIAKKLTIELIFERHPLWYREEQARCNVECDDPNELVKIVDQQLANPAQSTKQELRQAHLQKWCASPDGTSSLRLARTIASALYEKRPVDWSKLDFDDFRRAAKLLLFRKLGVAYHYNPLLGLKRALFRDRYAVRVSAYQKSIKPGDVVATQKRIQSLRQGEFK